MSLEILFYHKNLTCALRKEVNGKIRTKNHASIFSNIWRKCNKSPSLNKVNGNEVSKQFRKQITHIKNQFYKISPIVKKALNNLFKAVCDLKVCIYTKWHKKFNSITKFICRKFIKQIEMHFNSFVYII